MVTWHLFGCLCGFFLSFFVLPEWICHTRRRSCHVKNLRGKWRSRVFFCLCTHFILLLCVPSHAPTPRLSHLWTSAGRRLQPPPSVVATPRLVRLKYLWLFIFFHVVYSNWQVSFSVDLSFQFSSCRQQPVNSEKIKVVTAGLCQSLERLNKNELTCNPNISVKDEQLGGWFFFFLSSGKKMVFFFLIVWRKGLCGCGLFVCCVQSRLKPLERTASHSQQRHLLTCWPVCAGLTGLNYCEHLELVIWFRTTDSSWGQHSR